MVSVLAWRCANALLNSMMALSGLKAAQPEEARSMCSFLWMSKRKKIVQHLLWVRAYINFNERNHRSTSLGGVGGAGGGLASRTGERSLLRCRALCLHPGATRPPASARLGAPD